MGSRDCYRISSRLPNNPSNFAEKRLKAKEILAEFHELTRRHAMRTRIPLLVNQCEDIRCLLLVTFSEASQISQSWFKD
jgi:hypothetical protein